MTSFKQMDLDAYSAAHREEWDRLAQLGKKRRFTGAEADELIDRYQSGASQLSAITTTSGQSAQGDRLSLYLSRARLAFTGVSSNALAQVIRFFAVQLPAALYRIRWLSLAVSAASVIVAVVYGLWATANPLVLETLGSASTREQYAMEDFVNYYSDNTEAAFTGYVWTNNAWIATQSVAFGIIPFFAPYIMFTNAQSLGLTGAMMAEFDRLDVFFLYISPHGQLELYSIFVAGAAGIFISWSWIAPGGRTRAQALAEDGRALFTVAVGLTLALLLSGLVEGFVTRQDWPWPIKIGIGTVALAAFLVYQWVQGRRAFLAGHTGDLDEFESGAKRLIAA
ncbi:putative membrane protein SpoIIM required for sporulation [Conyzicola lurida]|uniref:Putative membrane protein SpoIIM required for sporulation n=2 Tax=Conyzicola lurida TaxID=1172621 RepID=A0A841APG2_9MICO|nr:putative membrane protein SpoIIM required for sporulation [Conyzicola lurida]